MMQFTVPQFIDVEDKIIGPLTTRQFLIMIVCFMIIFIFYKLFDFTLFLVAGVFMFGICGVIAFFRVNGMPFHFFILNFLETSSRPGLRVWNNAYGKLAIAYEAEDLKPSEIGPVPVKLVTTSRLAELSLIVDTQGAYRNQGQVAPTEIKRLKEFVI